LTEEELDTEGDEMQHCVGNYFEAVLSKESVIVALSVPNGDDDSESPTLGPPVDRSTAEIGWRSCNVYQHRGPGNREPSELCEKALTEYLKRWDAKRMTVADEMYRETPTRGRIEDDPIEELDDE
jgi:hypothetical protein